MVRAVEPKQEVIRLLLAFRRGMVAELCAQALARKTGIKVIAFAESAHEALEAAKSQTINVALIGSALKDGPLSGLRALQLIQEARPSIRSVVLLKPKKTA